MGQAGLREDQGIDRRQVEADGRWICSISGQRSHLHQMRSRLYSRRGIWSDRVRCTDHSYCPGQNGSNANDWAVNVYTCIAQISLYVFHIFFT